MGGCGSTHHPIQLQAGEADSVGEATLWEFRRHCPLVLVIGAIKPRRCLTDPCDQKGYILERKIHVFSETRTVRGFYMIKHENHVKSTYRSGFYMIFMFFRKPERYVDFAPIF